VGGIRRQRLHWRCHPGTMGGSSGAGWSSLAARRAHNPKVVGSNPTPATNQINGLRRLKSRILDCDQNVPKNPKVVDSNFSLLLPIGLMSYGRRK
jgi:hypothetical protein